MLVLHHPVLLGADEELMQVAQALRRVHAYRRELAG
jgi:hypothetical protein